MSEAQRQPVGVIHNNGYVNGAMLLRSPSAASQVDEFCFALKGKRPIHSILIANNGMAAVKFMRSIRTWSYETFGTEKAILLVAMATPEDMRINAEHIRIADQFVEVPGGTNNNNYANVQLIVEMAESTRVDAVWPGWGHASENPELPDALTSKGIIFLGPPATSMAALGDKIGSSLIAQAAEVPTLPWSGSHVKISPQSCMVSIPDDMYSKACVYTTEEAIASCQVVGYPAMIKASWGGGGKGIRKVHNDEEVKALFKQVQGEVPGSPIFIMKVASQSRHLEVQLLCDQYNNVAALHSRDCSVQRRHQKIIEEGPITVAPLETVKKLEQAARRLAKCVNYVGAATVEYLYSMDTGEYYFLELNPRLQVEHPVTEWIAEINLPAAQVAVGMGIPLWQIPEIRRFYGMEHGAGYDAWRRTSVVATPFDFDKAESTWPKGHCVAVRVTSEDPDDGFKPTSGKVQSGEVFMNFLILNLDPAYDAHYQVRNFNRSSFPRGFVFGSASAAYQVEGAWNSDGKGPSTWDVYTHGYPEKIEDHSSGDVAANSYHKYKEDVELLKKMNMDAYRFSVSWPRILPTGKISGGVNEKGIEYYNKLIDHLVANGIKPAVTLFHWDTPQALEEEYGGFLSNKIAEDFRDFANLCFERFGDRVKFWITLNEPLSYVQQGYDIGRFAPHRCSSWRNNNCTAGDSATEPYIVMHNMLLAHAAAVKVYRTKYQADQKGVIGITLVASWMVPYSSSVADRHATDRAKDFQMGWNIAPVVYGEYPKSMRTLVGNRLPKFTEEESESLKGSFDFLGLNYYAASYGKDASDVLVEHPSYSTDSLTASLDDRNGTLIGEEAGSNWLHIYPRGIRKMLLYVKHKYKDPVIYITENGVDDKDDPSVPLHTTLKDRFRIKYYYEHLKYLRQSIHDGVKLRGFFAWALADNFEWADGYTVRFGLNYVDFRNPARPRYPKLSAEWFENFLSRSGTHQ